MITSNKSVLFNSERGRDIYVEGQRIIIKISPESAPLINTSDSYLQFSVLLGNNKTGQANPNYVIPDPLLGSNCFRSMTIRSGDGSVVLEQLNSMALWTAMKNFYGSNENDENLRAIFEGQASLVNERYYDVNDGANPNSNTSWATRGGNLRNPNRGGGFGSQYYEMNNMTSDNAKKVQVQYRFPMSGLLSSMKSELLPVLVLQGLVIELELMEGSRFLRLQNVEEKINGTVNRHQLGYGLVEDGWVQKTAGQANQTYSATPSAYGLYGYWDSVDTGAAQQNTNVPAATPITGLILQKSADGGDKFGLDNIQNCSIKVGSKVRVFYDLQTINSVDVTGALIDSVVTSVFKDTNGRINIRFNPFTTKALHANITTGQISVGNPIVCSLTSGETPATFTHVNTAAQLKGYINKHHYEISDVEYVANVVQTPPQYLEAMVKQVKSGKLRIQYNSYRDIAVNIPIGSLANEMNIFTDLQRCYSLFGLNEVLTNHTFLDESFKPSTSNLFNYQFQIAGINTPNQAVTLQRTSGGKSDTLALIEFEKALNESSIPVKNLRNPQNYFIIGRRLGAYGSSVNMLGKSLKCRVNYTGSQPESLLWHWFLYHTKMIEFEGGQIVVRE